MTRLLLVGAAAFTMLSGHARAQTPAATTRAHDTTMDCPMGVTGTKVSTAHTEDGEALTFSTTTPAKVADLRRRVHAAAEMHNKNHAAGGTHGDTVGDGMMGGTMESDHMMGGTMMPQSHATVTDVDKGACITLTPSTSTDLKELQSAVRVRAERMQQHGCGTVAQK